MRETRSRDYPDRKGYSSQRHRPGGGATKRSGPRLSDVLSGCNRRALHYSKRVDIAATELEWIDQHEQEVLPWGQRWLRRITALFLLLPLGMISMGTLISLLTSGTDQNVLFSIPVWYTLLGCLVWIVISLSGLFHPAFLYVYVYGHELTHLLAIYASGGRVSDFKVSLEGGHVITDKNNMFIALSPYFLPIWVLAWFLLAGIVSLVQPWESFAPVVFGGLGFWWAFHFHWTIWVIPKDQPDLNENGTFFSLMVIYLINLAFITAALVAMGAIRIRELAGEFIIQTHQFFSLMEEIIQWFNKLL